jgi:hypothetical protein
MEKKDIFDIKISDLKGFFRSFALDNQLYQGNEKNQHLNLFHPPAEGGFDWNKTKEGFDFWYAVANQDFPEAIKLYQGEYNLLLIENDGVTIKLTTNTHKESKVISAIEQMTILNILEEYSHLGYLIWTINYK